MFNPGLTRKPLFSCTQTKMREKLAQECLPFAIQQHMDMIAHFKVILLSSRHVSTSLELLTPHLWAILHVYTQSKDKRTCHTKEKENKHQVLKLFYLISHRILNVVDINLDFVCFSSVGLISISYLRQIDWLLQLIQLNESNLEIQ